MQLFDGILEKIMEVLENKQKSFGDAFWLPDTSPQELPNRYITVYQEPGLMHSYRSTHLTLIFRVYNLSMKKFEATR